MNAVANQKSLVAAPSLTEHDRQLITDAETTLAVAREYVIDSPEMYDLAGKELAEVKQRLHAVTVKRDDLADPYINIKREAEAGRKKIFDFFEPAINYLKQADTALTRAIASYRRDQEAKRKQLEAEALAEQRKQTEAAEKKAQKAEAKGDTTKAEQIRASVPLAAPPVALPEVPGKIAGVTLRKTWKGRIKGDTDEERATNRRKLLKFVSEHSEWSNLFDLNETALNQAARALQANLGNTIEGVEAYEDDGSARGR